MKSLLSLAVLLALSGFAAAQNTSVTATVLDGVGTPIANGTWKAEWVGERDANQSGNRNFTKFASGTLSGTGLLTTSLPDTSTIVPVGSQWRFTICPQASVPCSNFKLPVTGASADLSAQLVLPTIVVKPDQMRYAYSDSEMPTGLNPGAYYWNLTSGSLRTWNGSTWSSAAGGGVQSVSVGGFSPLFTTSNTGTSTNPVFASVGSSASGSTVFGNCAVGSGLPSFCNITGAMLPATIGSNTTGNAATASALAANGSNCTTGNYPLGVDAAGNVENCTALPAGGSGTVTSVALSLPATFTVTGSPITGAGTLTGTYASQTGNTVFAAPNGSTGTPTFRALVPGDISVPIGIQYTAYCITTATASATLGMPGLGSFGVTGCSGTTKTSGPASELAGTLKNLRVFAETGGVNASSGVFTVLVNGTTTAITCTVGTGTSCSDTTHTVAVAVGDRITVQFTTQAAETLAKVGVSVFVQE